jgi:hypothetical protein
MGLLRSRRDLSDERKNSAKSRRTWKQKARAAARTGEGRAPLLLRSWFECFPCHGWLLGGAFRNDSASHAREAIAYGGDSGGTHMAKQGQHQKDSHGQSSGRNNPKESVPVTAGTPKKQETYEAQVRARKDTDPQPQYSAPRPTTEDHRDPNPGHTRASNPRSGRSGSDSNADSGTRGN